MPAEDINLRKERLINESRKIVENINAMTFTNLDDQQVHSLMTMREIARGIINNRVEKVTKSDVKKALSSSIEKMVGSCKDVNNILSRIPCDGMDDEQTQSVSRMKEIVSTIVTRRAKVTTTRHEPVESVGGVEAETVESKMGGAVTTTNNDIDIGGLQRRLFENELPGMEAETGNKDGQNEERDTVMEEPTPSGNGDVLGGGEQGVILVDGANAASNEVQIGQVEGMMFEDVQLVVEADELRTEYGQSEMVEPEELRIENGQSEMMEVDELRTEDGNNEMVEASALTTEDGRNEMVEAEELRTEDGKNKMVEAVELRTEDGQNEMVEADGLRTEEGQSEMQKTINETSERKNQDNQNEVTKAISLSPLRLSLVWPPDGKITLDWVKNMMTALDQSSKKDPPSEFWSLMPVAVVDRLISAASSILSKEPNCVEIDCQGKESRVVVVGDVNGQFHDLLNLFKLAGLPSEKQFYVFNGNYVDRGAWGLEVFLVLLAWKVLMPNRVYLLRGNHETKFSTSIYGFEQEVKTKFGDQGEMVYKHCLECFKELPLASVIARCVYTTHGGLFRSMHIGPLRRSKRKRAQTVELGSLEELSKVKRSLIDAPDGGSNVLLGDVLWSNPSTEDGLFEMGDQGMGLSWGPDCTETFLKQANLKLIIRSHEGPDARAGQDDFGDMLSGYSMDHDGDSGKLYTLFSAPDYPQFGETKYNNEGAYAVLKPPNFESPSFHSFKAVERPEMYAQPTTDRASSSQTIFPPWMSSRVDFDALGISNPPSWSVPLADDTGATRVVQIPRAPTVEGLPLPSDLQEPHKAAFEYLFELIAALKHMISTRVIENGVHESAEEGRVPKEKEGQNNDEVNLKQAEEGIAPNEKEGQNNEVELKQAEEGIAPNEKEGQTNDVNLKQAEEDGQNNGANLNQAEEDGQTNGVNLNQAEEGSAPNEKEGQNNDVNMKQAEEGSAPNEKEGQNNDVNMKQEGQNNDVNMKQAGEGSAPNEKGEQNNDVNVKQAEEGSAPPNEKEEQSNDVNVKQAEEGGVPNGKESDDINLKQAEEGGVPNEKEEQSDDANLKQAKEGSAPNENGQNNEVNLNRAEEGSAPDENEGENHEVNLKQAEEGSAPDEKEGQNNEVNLKPGETA